MKPYPKIDTVYERDPDTNYSTLIPGDYARSEFKYLRYNDWICTEKMDGTNIRVQWTSDGFTFKGRKDKSEIPPYLHESLRDIFEARESAMSEVFAGKEVCLYGEGVGHKIQKNGDRYYEDGQTFILFDVWVDGWWLSWSAVCDVADKLAIQSAPYMGTMNLYEMVECVEKGNLVSRFGQFVPEGIVARPDQQLFFQNGDPIRTKIKHCDFEE